MKLRKLIRIMWLKFFTSLSLEVCSKTKKGSMDSSSFHVTKMEPSRRDISGGQRRGGYSCNGFHPFEPRRKALDAFVRSRPVQERQPWNTNFGFCQIGSWAEVLCHQGDITQNSDYVQGRTNDAAKTTKRELLSCWQVKKRHQVLHQSKVCHRLAWEREKRTWAGCKRQITSDERL